MKELGKVLLVLAAFGAIGVSMSLVPQKAASGTTSEQTSAPLPVNVTNPALAVRQTGPWNVGVSGTPTVNVASLPAITGNVSATDRDSQARNFYQDVVSNGPCTGTCVVSFPVVPAGKRLIVQQVSTLVTFSSAGAGAPADIELRGGSVFQFLPITPAPANFGSQTQYLAHAGVLAAYDGGQNPSVDAFVPSASSYSTLASISGYMIDIP